MTFLDQLLLNDIRNLREYAAAGVRRASEAKSDFDAHVIGNAVMTLCAERLDKLAREFERRAAMVEEVRDGE